MADSDGKVRIIIDTNAEAAAKQLNDVGTAFKKNADTINNASTVYNGYEKAVRDNIQVLRELAIGGNQNTEGFKQLAAQTKDYKKVLDEANQAVDKATGGISQQISPVNALASKLKTLVGAYLGLRGIGAIINYSKEAVSAFREQERAILSLNNTLANAGVYSYDYSQSIQNLASEIQSYSNYGDEAIIKAQALGQSFIGQTKITNDLTKAVVDFAAATGMDLEQAFTLVGKSIGSNTNALGRYCVVLKKGMSDSQKMEAITRQLADRYTGSAKAMSDTSIQLKNAIGDLSESIGNILNPAVKSAEKYFMNVVKAATQMVNQIHVAVSEIGKLDEAQLQTKLRQNWVKQDENNRRAKEFYQVFKSGTPIEAIASKGFLEQSRKLKAEEQAIRDRLRQVIQENKAQEKTLNKTAIKYSDDFGSPAGMSAASSNRATTATNKAKEIKDAYDLATEAVEKARKAVLNAAIQFGESSPQVQQAFEQYKLANDKIAGLQDIFKTEETKTKFQLLQEEIQRTTEKLQDLYLSGQGGTDAFITTKNHLSELQTQMQDMNTAITSNVGLSWDNVANSIRSNLTSALTTPLREGESAFDRLGKIGLNVVQQIGQEIITNLLKQVTLQSTLKAMGSIFSFFGGGGGIGGGIGMAMAGAIAKNGKVFNHGKVVPFARGGIVNKPTLFPMKNGMGLMGEAGAEAVMPLTRKNGRLGVEATGANQTVVNIYNQSGSSIETQTREDGSMVIFIRKFNSALNNERTSGSFRSAYQRESTKGVQAC